jgi:predicted dehydrogenase
MRGRIASGRDVGNMRTLGVGIVGFGWVATQHLSAFLQNPHARVRYLCSRSESRMRERLARAGISCPDCRLTTRYRDLLESSDIDIVAIATPNHLHARQAVAAARAGKHILLEKPTGLDLRELAAIRDAVRRAGVRTIVSFELHYHPYLRVARWLRESGRLGQLHFARFQYLSRVTDWYSGWSWVRTAESGRSHLLAAGCHAVDAMRWCTGLELEEVSAYHVRHTRGYQYPTSIIVNARLQPSTGRTGRVALGQIVSSTDFQMPYSFGVELMGDRATLAQDLILWNDVPVDVENLRSDCPVEGVSFEAGETPTGAPAIKVRCEMPGSADVTHHPFQGEIDELVACVREGRETHLSVFDAQRTMEACIAADRSAARSGRPVRLPLLKV